MYLFWNFGIEKMIQYVIQLSNKTKQVELAKNSIKVFVQSQVLSVEKYSIMWFIANNIKIW